MRPSFKTLALIVGLILIALLPLVLEKFHVYLLTEVMIYAMLGASYYLLLGHTGLLSLGHAAYFGLGGYTTAFCLVYGPEIPLPIALLAGALTGLLSGLIIGSMLLRLTKIYYSFATLAFSQMLWASAWKWRSLTGGDDGLTGWSSRQVSLPFLGRFSLSDVTFLFYLVFAVALVSILLCWYFIRTPLGNTLAGIKANPNRASFLGIHNALAKLMLFGFSGLIAGTSGALFILFKKMASPNFLDMFTSFDIVVLSVVGGYSSFAGPLVGSFVHVYMVEYLSSFTERWQLIMGLFFMMVILFFSGGLVGLLRRLSARIPLLKGAGK
ncbi:MAG: branched-chain amino acid ABC transporter permease [Deltaproteobacteria bacterium]|nr:branched-chain amino acid ABC transporter permease [Deltaproteobacteria bacterium]